MRFLRSERGAAAVEFALVVPLLVALLLGIVEFGRAYNVQVSVTQASREAARSMAIKGSVDEATAVAKAAAPALDPELMTVTASSSSCSAGTLVTMTVQYKAGSLTGLLPADTRLTGKSAMRCGG